MGESVAFSTLIAEAARLVMKRRAHFWCMVAFGLMAVVGSATSHWLGLDLDQIESLSTADAWAAWLASHRMLILSLIALSLGALLAESAIRGPVILILEETLLAHTKTPAGAAPLSWSRLTRTSAKAVMLVFGYFLISCLAFGLVFAPVWLAWRFNPTALPSVLQLSSVFFIALSILLYFIKEYALYYLVLGRVKPRSALDLGYSLFRRNIFPSLLFGLLLIGLSLIFTLTLDSAIITSARLTGESLGPALVVVFVLAGPFAVFREITRLLFFHSLASPKEKDRVATKTVSPEEASETAV